MPNSTSSPRAASLESPDAVVDTVVLRYFLLVDETDLLVKLCGSPLGVPRIVYDPEEPDQTPDAARSEITLSISYQQRASRDRARQADVRADAARNARRLQAVADLHRSGAIATIDLSEEEFDLFGRLTSPTACKEFDLRVPLGAGEAACIAAAIQRGCVLATDDTDALRALNRHMPGHPYERIRRLLRRAGESGLYTRDGANEIHREMCRLGFWDHKEPFPAGS